MFSFGLVQSKKSFKEALELIRGEVDSSFDDEIGLIVKGEGCLVPILFKYTFFTDEGDVIKFHFKDRVIEMDLEYCNAFCATFKYTYDYSEFFEIVTRYMSGTGYTGIGYKDSIRECENDSGQSKILLSTLVPLVDSDREVDILVIGSSSNKVDGTKNIEGGRTYEVLADMLDHAGYNGSMYCIDPCEETHDVKCGNISIHYQKGCFSWKDPIPGKFTHVFDDVWIRADQLEVKKVPLFGSVKYDLKEGKSKFSYRVRNGRFEFVSGLKEHVDLEGAIGGGHVKCRGLKLKFFGTSLHVGHYDRSVLEHVFAKYKVKFIENFNYGRKIWDPDARAFSTYPGAVVLTKYFGEKYEGGHVLPQTFYEKNEERYLFGKDVKIPFRGGCGCNHCRWYDLIRTRFKIYKNDIDIDYFLSRIISDGCVKRKGDEFRKICNLVCAAVRTKSCFKYIMDELKQKGYGVSKILRAVMYLVRFKKISIPITELYDPRYNIEIGGKLYRDGSNVDYYDIEGEYVVKKCTVVPDHIVLTYRSGVDYRYKAAVYFSSVFKDVFSFIDGYSDLVLRGCSPCGFNDLFEYSIEEEGKGCLIMRYEQYGLYKNY